MSAIRAEMKAKLGKYRLAITSADYVHISSDPLNVPSDYHTKFRGKEYHASVHLTLREGEWLPVNSSHVYFATGICDTATAFAAAKMLEDIKEAWNAFVKANPDELKKAEKLSLENELQKLYDARKEALARLSAIENSIASTGMKLNML